MAISLTRERCLLQGAAKMMAKQVVMNRKQQEKLYKGRAQLNGVSNMAKVGRQAYVVRGRSLWMLC